MNRFYILGMIFSFFNVSFVYGESGSKLETLIEHEFQIGSNFPITAVELNSSPVELGHIFLEDRAVRNGICRGTFGLKLKRYLVPEVYEYSDPKLSWENHKRVTIYGEYLGFFKLEKKGSTREQYLQIDRCVEFQKELSGLLPRNRSDNKTQYLVDIEDLTKGKVICKGCVGKLHLFGHKIYEVSHEKNLGAFNLSTMEVSIPNTSSLNETGVYKSWGSISVIDGKIRMYMKKRPYKCAECDQKFEDSKYTKYFGTIFTGVYSTK